MRPNLCPIIEKNGHRFYGGKLRIYGISGGFWMAVCLGAHHALHFSELYVIGS